MPSYPGMKGKSGSLFEAGDGQTREAPGAPLNRDGPAVPDFYGTVAELGGRIFHSYYDPRAIQGGVP